MVGYLSVRPDYTISLCWDVHQTYKTGSQPGLPRRARPAIALPTNRPIDVGRGVWFNGCAMRQIPAAVSFYWYFYFTHPAGGARAT